jgi:hypothetical protein
MRGYGTRLPYRRVAVVWVEDEDSNSEGDTSKGAGHTNEESVRASVLLISILSLWDKG